MSPINCSNGLFVFLNKKTIFKSTSLALVLLMSFFIFTITKFVFADGPIQITTCEELQLIGNDEAYPLHESYILNGPGGIIDCSGTQTWNLNEEEWDEEELILDSNEEVTNNGYFGFEPIGDSEYSFSGVLDGNDNTITGLWIFRKETEDVGLFSVLDEAHVFDLNITDSNIVGYAYVGTLSGGVVDSTLTNIQVSDSMVRSYYDFEDNQDAAYTGGVIGHAEASTELGEVFFDGIVYGKNYVGGLVGYLTYSSISGSGSDATIYGSSYVGGAVGYASEGNIEESYAIGTVGIISSETNASYFGGFIGGNYDNTEIIDSSADVDVTGTEYIGGFVGENRGESLISNSTAEGNVKGVYYIGGFAGTNEDEYSEISDSSASGDVTFFEENEIGESRGYVFGGFVGVNDDYAEIYDSFATGNVGGTMVERVGGFVGDNINDGIIEDSFATGIVTARVEGGGFVGKNQDGSLIENSYATGNVYVQRNGAGGFVAFLEYATINRSYALGDVYGNVADGGYERVGGFVGRNAHEGVITKSYAKGNVFGYNRVGGFAGASGNTIEDSYSWGNVTGNVNVGGFIGKMGGGHIKNVYSIGQVSGVDSGTTGGFIGDFSSNSVSDAFWNIDTAGVETAEGTDSSSESGAEGKTTAELRSFDTYPLFEQITFSLEEVVGDAEYRYIKWVITDTKDVEAEAVQSSEFALYLDGQKVSWPEATTVENPDGDYDLGWGEGPESLIDNDLETKWLDYGFADNLYLSTIIFDVGEGETVSFDGYVWATGNDEDWRDPYTWSIYGSNNGEDYVLLDNRVEEYVTDNRNVYAFLSDGGWDFESIWDINSEENNMYPFLRGIQDAEGEEEVVTHTLTYTAGTGGSVSGSTSQVVNSGSNGSSVTATPSSGYRFVRWSDNVTTNPRTDTNVTQNKSVSAVFERLVTISGSSGSRNVNTNATVNNRNSNTGVVNNNLTPTNVQITANSGTGKTSFLRNLDVGSIGGDVRDLQKFLNARGFLVNVTGPGSLNNETDTFGQFTKSALAKFQAANGIVPSAGYFGPLTRAFIEKMTSNSSPVPVTNENTSTVETNNSVPQTVRDLEFGMTGDDVKALQNILISNNYSIPVGATGYFGEYTKKAIIKYQTDNNISPVSGYLGPKTRAQMKNAGVTGLWW